MTNPCSMIGIKLTKNWKDISKFDGFFTLAAAVSLVRPTTIEIHLKIPTINYEIQLNSTSVSDYAAHCIADLTQGSHKVAQLNNSEQNKTPEWRDRPVVEEFCQNSSGSSFHVATPRLATKSTPAWNCSDEAGVWERGLASGWETGEYRMSKRRRWQQWRGRSCSSRFLRVIHW